MKPVVKLTKEFVVDARVSCALPETASCIRTANRKSAAIQDRLNNKRKVLQWQEKEMMSLSSRDLLSQMFL